jgi:DNA-binding CsgD family transcriptional regulator
VFGQGALLLADRWLLVHIQIRTNPRAHRRNQTFSLALDTCGCLDLSSNIGRNDMYVSAEKRRALSRLIELLAADHADSANLRAAIGGSLLELLEADLYSSYAWNPRRRVFESGVALNLDSAYVERYEAYFQHGHLATASRWLKRGVSIVSSVIPHRDLMKTEIYNDFLRPSGHHYGINLFAFDGHHSIGDLRIWRRNGRPDFGRDEVALLTLIEPGFIAALKRTGGAADPIAQATTTASKLSPREAEIAELAAQGRTDKEIARHLNLTFSTVRTHLDNAFAKLGARNRAQLSSLLHPKLRDLATRH